MSSSPVLNSPIEYLKGVGPAKGDLFRKELGIYTFADLLMAFPYRYVDKTQFHKIRDLDEYSETVQIRGVLRRLESEGAGSKKRLVGRFRDDTGVIELVWFKGVAWLEKSLQVGGEYVVFGKVNDFRGKLNIPHPEIEPVTAAGVKRSVTFAPVYSNTELLSKRGLDSRARGKLIQLLFEKIQAADIPENLPAWLREKFKFPDRYTAIKQIHFPRNQKEMEAARNRLKFEELFFLQLRLLQIRGRRKETIKGIPFSLIGQYFMRFFNEKLPFELTNAQKKVIKEIRKDMGGGGQMNRLLQGDVGSGKTIVGLMSMLIALDNGCQACLMAPTEILAQQHFEGITGYLEGMDVSVGFLTGSVKGKKRKALLEQLQQGEIDILIGTHAIIEDWVVFKNLGLAITDEQHRFGVKHRAKLWYKNQPSPPHILVMTATPIPRTLAMTLYGDLEVSVIDELPPGRKEIKTIHRHEGHRLRVIGFMKEEIAKGRQIYVVFPLIEESAKLDLQNLEDGYELLLRDFPPPDYQISVVHGRMKAKDKEYEMKRFSEGTTQIMVATTVIEVGVNVPNASVMIIENTERFGLSQLHQLRGRVGRGAEQSYCILMTGYKLSKEARSRIQTMTGTNDGFKIAEADLRLRGPGNMEGTQQSGILNFKLADLSKDQQILQLARETAARILDKDPRLAKEINRELKRYMDTHGKKYKAWSRIS